jgi:prephenate dehydrogenase
VSGKTDVPACTVVCGVGLIGGSLAAAGRRAGALGRVIGVGRSRANLDVALERGIVDEVTTDVAAAMREADLVVLAAPVDTCVELLATAASETSQTCVVTDVCSVKLPLCERAAQVGIEARFVGAHPMAGSHRSGAAGADPDLFRDRVTVVVESGRAQHDAHVLVTALWRAVGSSVLEIGAEAHDRVTAMTSHLPQMVVFALAAAVGRSPEQGLVRALTGPGLRDTTRLAASEHAMWTSIARANRMSLLVAFDTFSEAWTELRAAVAAGDEAAMMRVMGAARDARAAMEADTSGGEAQQPGNREGGES